MQSSPPPTLGEISESDYTYIWINRNRGKCSEIARDLGVSSAFVRSVLYGHSKSTNFRVEKLLILANAPFVADRIAEAKTCTA